MANDTLARMFWSRVESGGDRPAQQFKHGTGWTTLTRRQVGEIVRELGLLSVLRHPHIVYCYGGQALTTDSFMVTELVTHRSRDLDQIEVRIGQMELGDRTMYSCDVYAFKSPYGTNFLNLVL